MLIIDNNGSGAMGKTIQTLFLLGNGFGYVSPTHESCSNNYCNTSWLVMGLGFPLLELLFVFLAQIHHHITMYAVLYIPFLQYTF